MDTQKFSGGSFVKVANVKEGPIKERIGTVTLGKWDKPNLVFESGNLLSVNATNNQILMRAYGRNSDDWAGKEVELYLGEIEFQGTPREAVLVRPISPPLKPAERTKPLSEPKAGRPEAKPEQQKPKAPKDDPFNDSVDDLER